MIKTEFTFDENTHEYKLRGYPLPSVTQVLADLLPGWKASEFYLGKGRAIHAACAMIAHGKSFTFDKRIVGQIAACEKFFTDTKIDPIEVEKPAFSKKYQFAGTVDLIARVGSTSPNPLLRAVFDWKSCLTDIVPFQLAAYGILFNVDWGMAVQLNDDGTYKCSELYNLKSFKLEFLALLTAYNIRKKLNLTEKESK